MRGSKTPDDKVRKFKRKLLELGTASAAARACKIPVTTGCELAREIYKDPEFVKVRNSLNAQAIDHVEAILLAGIDRANEMIQSGPHTTKGIAQMMKDYGLKSFQDPRPQYLAQVVNGHRTLIARQRLAQDQGAAHGGPVKVVLEFTDGSSGSAEDDGASEVPSEPSTEPGSQGSN